MRNEESEVTTAFLTLLNFGALLHQHYSDFDPTLAAEKLHEKHKIIVSAETIRKWMIAEVLWVPYVRRNALVI